MNQKNYFSQEIWLKFIDCIWFQQEKLPENNMKNCKWRVTSINPVSTYAKFSKKLTFVTPWYVNIRDTSATCAYQGVKNISFLEI